MEHPHIETIRLALKAYETGDREEMERFLAPDIVWHVGGDHRLSGDYRGRDAVLDYYETIRSETGGTLQLEPVSIMADDEHAAIFMRVTGKRGSKKLDTVLAEALRLDRDGRWLEYWALAEDQPAVDAFWGGAR
jgi:hypothetical protein